MKLGRGESMKRAFQVIAFLKRTRHTFSASALARDLECSIRPAQRWLAAAEEQGLVRRIDPSSRNGRGWRTTVQGAS